MVEFVEQTGEHWETVTAEEGAPAGSRTFFIDVGSSTGSPTVVKSAAVWSVARTAVLGSHATEAVSVSRQFEPTSDPREVAIGARDQDIEALIRSCNNLFDRMLEVEDVIERENLYQTINERLLSLFELRSSRERAFGHLLVLLLGVTQNTTSEFFSEKQFSVLNRAIKIASKPMLGERDLQEAEDLLSGAQFDIYRPLRGVFNTENV